MEIDLDICRIDSCHCLSAERLPSNVFERFMLKWFRQSRSSSDLFSSARAGDFRRARRTVLSGVPVDIRDTSGRTALCLAAKYGRTEVVKILLELGADVNIVGPDNRTPIYFAIYSRSIEVVRLLIAAGARLDVQDSVGYSPYNYAVSRSQTGILELLRKEDEKG